MERLGYRADIAGNGYEALDALRRQPYDVVLMDVQMPDMDGLEATRQIVEEWSNDKRPRIVAMTANAMQGDREMCIEAGMDDYISKPIRTERLIDALKQCRPLTDVKWDSKVHGLTLPGAPARSVGTAVRVRSRTCSRAWAAWCSMGRLGQGVCLGVLDGGQLLRPVAVPFGG